MIDPRKVHRVFRDESRNITARFWSWEMPTDARLARGVEILYQEENVKAGRDAVYDIDLDNTIASAEPNEPKQADPPP
jgi:hypothetical protein